MGSRRQGVIMSVVNHSRNARKMSSKSGKSNTVHFSRFPRKEKVEKISQNNQIYGLGSLAKFRVIPWRRKESFAKQGFFRALLFTLISCRIDWPIKTVELSQLNRIKCRCYQRGFRSVGLSRHICCEAILQKLFTLCQFQLCFSYWWSVTAGCSQTKHRCEFFFLFVNSKSQIGKAVSAQFSKHRNLLHHDGNWSKLDLIQITEWDYNLLAYHALTSSERRNDDSIWR